MVPTCIPVLLVMEQFLGAQSLKLLHVSTAIRAVDYTIHVRSIFMILPRLGALEFALLECYISLATGPHSTQPPTIKYGSRYMYMYLVQSLLCQSLTLFSLSVVS